MKPQNQKQFTAKQMTKEFETQEDADLFAKRMFRQGWQAQVQQKRPEEKMFKVMAAEPEDVMLMRLLLQRSKEAPTKLAYEDWLDECIRRTMAEHRKQNVERDDNYEKMRARAIEEDKRASALKDLAFPKEIPVIPSKVAE